MSPIIEWLWRGFLTLLVAGNIFWIKRWIGKREKWEEEHDRRLMMYANEGNIVTRDKFFDFCEKVRRNCPVIDMVSWRNGILSKGGVMSKDEAHGYFGNLSRDILSSIERLFSEHDQKTEATVEGIKTQIDANAGKLDLVIKRQQEVVSRIDHHIDEGHKGGVR